jgi:hypothetical protein
MSPRAACRLEELGFTAVYDYVGGIADWKGAGLPIEGTADGRPRIADATRADVPTCRPDQSVEAALSDAAAAGWEMCVVVDCDGVVVGRLRSDVTHRDGHLVAEVMEPGPATVRPDGLLHPLVDRMDRKEVSDVLATTPEGRLIGVLVLDEAKRLLAGEPPKQIWRNCDGCPGRWAGTKETDATDTDAERR